MLICNFTSGRTPVRMYVRTSYLFLLPHVGRSHLRGTLSRYAPAPVSPRSSSLSSRCRLACVLDVSGSLLQFWKTFLLARGSQHIRERLPHSERFGSLILALLITLSDLLRAILFSTVGPVYFDLPEASFNSAPMLVAGDLLLAGSSLRTNTAETVLFPGLWARYSHSVTEYCNWSC